MKRNLAWNRTNGDSGVQSSRTSVSRSGSASLPCQSLSKRRGAESSQDDEDGNPSALSGAFSRTATAVRSCDIASCGGILANCPVRARVLPLSSSPQKNHCPAAHKKKVAVTAKVLSVVTLSALAQRAC